MRKVTPSEIDLAASANTRQHPLIYVALAACAALVLLAIPHHEPWADEAQSWLLARDSSLAHLWGTLLHYEGTPGLWQTLLHGLIRLGLPYSGLDFVSGILGLTAVYFLLRYAPLPLLVRALLPFTYYLCYQYAVIARSYALIAPLLFLVAALYPRARARIGLTTLLLALLAGVSVHGFLISICIWVTLYAPVLLRGSNLERKKIAAAGLAYCAVLAFLAMSAWPAADVAFAEHRGLANLGLLPAITQAGLAGAFTGYWIPSLVIIALSAPFLYRGGGWLFFLLAAVSFCLFGTIVYAQLWHFGILFLAWVFAMWISAYKTRVTPLALTALLAAIGIQCYWTAAAIHYDWTHPYSGSLATADYFHQTGVPPGGLYAIGYPSTAVQPYFPASIFSNFDGHGYWDWSQRNGADDPAALVSSPGREQVLVGYKNSAEKQRWSDVLHLLGYSVIQHFDGGTFWQTHIFESESYDLYRRTSPPRATSAVDMADPARAAQLLTGFYGIEGGRSRWTAKRFSVLLAAPPGSDRQGAELALALYVPDVQIRNLGPVTLQADSGGRQLGAQTFSNPGQYIFSAHVPLEMLRSGLLLISFELDKASKGLNGDARELGVIATQISLAPPSPAQ
jgi:hypothetical protein